MSEGKDVKSAEKREMRVKRMKLDQNKDRRVLGDIYGTIQPPGGQTRKQQPS